MDIRHGIEFIGHNPEMNERLKAIAESTNREQWSDKGELRWRTISGRDELVDLVAPAYGKILYPCVLKEGISIRDYDLVKMAGEVYQRLQTMVQHSQKLPNLLFPMGLQF